MSLKWIAEHLAMGSWTHVSNLLVVERKRESLKSENRHLPGTALKPPHGSI
jgi:hypothetical protein